MEAIITGDIIDSRKITRQDIWLEPLKETLSLFGTSPNDWDIFRGDSFQLRIPVQEAMHVSLLMLANFKKIRKERVDVRIAIGISEKSDSSIRISESMGEAFLFSGELLEKLKEKKLHLGIKSFDSDFDMEMNMMIKLALVILNGWSANSAEVASLMLRHSGITQQQLSEKLGIVQSSVNERISRGYLHEIMDFENYYRQRVIKLHH
jgi:hypothetical protein